jgi:hypothetical protein
MYIILSIQKVIPLFPCEIFLVTCILKLITYVGNENLLEKTS